MASSLGMFLAYRSREPVNAKWRLILRSLLFATGLSLFSISAFANPAICGKYSATEERTGAQVIVITQASDWDRDAGYTYVNTSLSGGLTKSCDSFYTGEPKACGVNLVNVKLISDSDCWE